MVDLVSYSSMCLSCRLRCWYVCYSIEWLFRHFRWSLSGMWAFPMLLFYFLFLSSAVGLCPAVFLVGMSIWCTGPGGNRVYSMVYYAMSFVRSDHCFHLHLQLIYRIGSSRCLLIVGFCFASFRFLLGYCIYGD